MIYIEFLHLLTVLAWVTYVDDTARRTAISGTVTAVTAVNDVTANCSLSRYRN